MKYPILVNGILTFISSSMAYVYIGLPFHAWDIDSLELKCFARN